MTQHRQVAAEAIEAFNRHVADTMRACSLRFDEACLAPAADMILTALQRGNRIHVTGIGKPHHISAYTASLFSSLGIPCYLLDGTEATHGSAGQVLPGDVVLCISYYGDVTELNRTVITLRENGAELIGVTGFPDSFIARQCALHLDVHVEGEGDRLGKAPRTSMLATQFAMMSLSLLLQERTGLTAARYVRWHPSGILGQDPT